MTASNPSADPPLAEPGTRPSGADVGGVRASTESGVADWAQRSSERGDQAAVGRASTGDAGSGGREPRDDGGGKGAPGSGLGSAARADRPVSDDRATPRAGTAGDPTASTAPSGSAGGTAGANDDDDEDQWRHPPVAPVDERNPLRSLGKAVADTLTNSVDGTPDTPKR